jgi:hypothetical protein
VFPHVKNSDLLTQMQEKSVDDVEVIWSKLASRATRVALARRDISLAQLASELTRDGLQESERSIQGKLSRGRFTFAFFLHALTAAGADFPTAWADALTMDNSWEARASAVFKRSLEEQRWIDWDVLAGRLSEIGVVSEPKALAHAVESGSFSTAFFLQCAAVCRFNDLQLFLDASSVNEAALAGAAASR